MTTERPEALRLASDIAASGQFTNLFTLDAAAAELRTQHARINELESQLAQRFDAADMATAAAQGFRDGAASAALASAPAQAAEPSITLDFKMATDLLGMFCGEPGLVTLQRGDEHCHSGPGLYAWYSDMPEEGAGFLGAEPDDEATPSAPSATAQPVAEASRFGSPELQAMIVARCVEKDRADSVQAAPVGAVESNTADAAPTQWATEMENLQRTAVGWQGRALRAERNWAVCRRWAIAGGAPVEKLGDDPDQPFHAASPAIEGESKWWPCPVAVPGPADGESK